MKMLSITVSALLASVASADVNCCLQYPTCPLGFVETTTPCTPEGLLSGTCTTASACCTTITCRQKDMCSVSGHGFCGGIANIQCEDGRVCLDNPDDGCDVATGGRDCGGCCVGAAVVNECDTNADCPSTQFCRTTRDTSSPDRFACLTTKECVDFQPEGAGCGGFTLPCFYNRCAAGLTCQCSEPTCDAPGTCVKETPPTPSFCSAQGPACGTGFDACKPGYTCTVDPTCQGASCEKCCVRDEEPCCPAPLSCPAGYGAVEGTDALICRIDMLLALLTGSTSACVEVTDQKQDGCCEDVICRKQAVCDGKTACTASTGCTALDNVCLQGSDGASCCVFNQCVLMDCGDQKQCMLDSEGRGQCI